MSSDREKRIRLLKEISETALAIIQDEKYAAKHKYRKVYKSKTCTGKLAWREEMSGELYGGYCALGSRTSELFKLSKGIK